MIKVNKKTLIFVALIIALIYLLTSNTFAISNPDRWNPNPSISQGGSFLAKAGVILGWIKYIGIIIGVVMLTIIGMKYLFSSVEGKAEYKKTMIPFVVGAFMLMGVSLVVQLIESIAKI